MIKLTDIAISPATVRIEQVLCLSHLTSTDYITNVPESDGIHTSMETVQEWFDYAMSGDCHNCPVNKNCPAIAYNE